MPTKSKPQATELDRGRRPDIEKDLSEKYHADWSFVSGVAVSQFNVAESQHNQARFEPINQATVNEYTEAVKRGDPFPAVVAFRPTPRSRYVIIDGNHRLAAHIAAETPLDVYEVSTKTDPRTIALMTFAMNTRHGRPTSESERLHQALYLIDNGSTIPAAAAAVNISVAALKRAVAKNNADRRADEVGLRRNEWDSLSSTVKHRLTNVSTDEGFEAAAQLAFAAKLDAQEVFDLVALANQTKSGTRQRAIIKGQRDVFLDRIQSTGGGVMSTGNRAGMGPKARVAMVIGQALALPEDDKAILAAYAVQERNDAAKKMREAGDRLHRLAGVLSPSK